MNTKEIGAFGERAAAEFLEDKDYEILEMNFRLKCGEIDIIASHDGCTVFAEVKTRRNSLYGEPSEYVDFRKQPRIKRTAACYTDIINNDVRFDVIEVFYRESGGKLFVTKINHIENAF